MYKIPPGGRGSIASSRPSKDARLRGPNNLLILHQVIKIEHDFPCLADEIAEPRQDMNIKVAAFTVSESLLINIDNNVTIKKQEMPQSQTADQPTAPRGREHTILTATPQ